MIIRKAAYCLFLSLFIGLAASAQKPSLRVDRNEIMIGEQSVVTLSFAISKANPAQVTFPTILDTLVENVEVVRKTKVDTLKTGDNVPQTRLQQLLYITSFDSGFYAIPPFEFMVNGEVKETEPFLLTVHSVKIDTTASIKGIKDIYHVEVSWLDYLNAYWKYAAAGIAAVALLALVIFLVMRYRKKEIPEEPVEEKDTRPADVIAMEALTKIAEEKIFKRGKIKEYHTSITDVLRDYIEAVFEIPASELTTRQIISQLRYSGIDDKEMRKLRSILFRADMVKFAKEIPDERENEQSVNDAEQFVTATKPPEARPQEKGGETKGNE